MFHQTNSINDRISRLENRLIERFVGRIDRLDERVNARFDRLEDRQFELISPKKSKH